MNKNKQHSMFMSRKKLSSVVHASSKTHNACKRKEIMLITMWCESVCSTSDNCVWLHRKSERERSKSPIFTTPINCKTSKVSSETPCINIHTCGHPLGKSRRHAEKSCWTPFKKVVLLNTMETTSSKYSHHQRWTCQNIKPSTQSVLYYNTSN